MAPMASMIARVGRNASARFLSAIPEAATALPAAAAASRAARSGNAGGDGRSVASMRRFSEWAHHEGRRLLSTRSSHGVDTVTGHEDHDQYKSPGILKVDAKDLESDEALWALYRRWCKYFKVERTHEEMIQRFDEFKKSVLYAQESKNRNNSCRVGINSLADRSLQAEFSSRPTIVSPEFYSFIKSINGCIMTSDEYEH